MRPPVEGDRVRFRAENELVEGRVIDVHGGLVRVLVDDGRRYFAGGGDVLVVEDEDALAGEAA